MRTAAANRHTEVRKEKGMQVNSLSHARRRTASLFVLASITALMAGCMQDDGSALERAQLQNLTSETALNAQIMSDRAREQRCNRDPQRKEC